MRLAIAASTLKALFARSGNACAFPECDRALVDTHGVVVCEVCHIEAAEPGGPRFNARMSDRERSAEPNLLLFCHEHHRLIDDPKTAVRYSPATLRRMKADHERRRGVRSFKVAPRVVRAVLAQLLQEPGPALALPFGLGTVRWSPREVERRAAWALYIELVTRIAIQPLKRNEGLLREALSSLHALFGTTREILKDAGPGLGSTNDTVGGLAIAVLNRGLRPFLAYWHPRLSAWEGGRPPSTVAAVHERRWPEHDAIRRRLDALRRELSKYACALALAAGVDPAPALPATGAAARDHRRPRRRR